MNESGYIRSIHKRLPSDVYHWKISDRYTAGIPDCWYCGPSADLWVEYKYSPTIGRTMLPALTALQLAWLNARAMQGINVAVIHGTPQGGVVHRDWDWTKPLSKDQFNNRLINNRMIAAWLSEFVHTLDQERQDVSNNHRIKP